MFIHVFQRPRTIQLLGETYRILKYESTSFSERTEKKRMWPDDLHAFPTLCHRKLRKGEQKVEKCQIDQDSQSLSLIIGREK
jgi:hypothetical protein